MIVIAWEKGHREVELQGNERRIHNYCEQLLDEGWDQDTALKYAGRRFGPVHADFVHWYKNTGPFAA
jgi:hypothetical protein